VKELRKKYTLARVGSRRHLLSALLKSYKQFGGAKKPRIAIVEFRHAYAPAQSEYELYRDGFRDEGYLVEIVSPEQHLVTPEKVKAAHAKGLQVVPWTSNTPAEWDKLIDAGVDAIISDDPAALIAHLKKKGLR